MSTPKEILKDWLEATNRFDLDFVASKVSPDITSTLKSSGIDTHGKEAFLEATRTVWQTYPDRQLIVKRMFGEGDLVAVEAEFVATSQGGADLPPAGTPIHMDLCTIFTVRDGLVVEERNFIDNEHLKIGRT
jgi:predicted ester cyclase